MNITDDKINLICSYYEQVVGIDFNEKSIEGMADILSGKMYDDLFEKHPEYRHFFPDSVSKMDELKCKLYEILRYAIMQLFSYKNKEITKRQAFTEIEEAFTRIGKFHKKIIDENNKLAIHDDHFMAVGDSLLFALKSSGESIWSKEMQDAWLALYMDLYSIMKNAMLNG